MSASRVCRMDEEQFQRLDRAQQEQIREWMRGLGLEPNNLRPYLAVTREGDQLLLHLSEYILDERGCKTLDHAMDDVATRPLVRPIDGVPFFLVPANEEAVA